MQTYGFDLVWIGRVMIVHSLNSMPRRAPSTVWSGDFIRGSANPSSGWSLAGIRPWLRLADKRIRAAKRVARRAPPLLLQTEKNIAGMSSPPPPPPAPPPPARQRLFGLGVAGLAAYDVHRLDHDLSGLGLEIKGFNHVEGHWPTVWVRALYRL